MPTSTRRRRWVDRPDHGVPRRPGRRRRRLHATAVPPTPRDLRHYRRRPSPDGSPCSKQMSMYFDDAPAEAMLGTVADDPNNAPGKWMAHEWMHQVTENPAAGAVEVWELYNATADAHPMHIHNVSFEVLNRQDIIVDEEAQTVQVVPESTPTPGRIVGDRGQGNRHRLPRPGHPGQNPVQHPRTVRLALPHRRTRRQRNDAPLPRRTNPARPARRSLGRCASDVDDLIILGKVASTARSGLPVPSPACRLRGGAVCTAPVDATASVDSGVRWLKSPNRNPPAVHERNPVTSMVDLISVCTPSPTQPREQEATKVRSVAVQPVVGPPQARQPMTSLGSRLRALVRCIGGADAVYMTETPTVREVDDRCGSTLADLRPLQRELRRTIPDVYRAFAELHATVTDDAALAPPGSDR